MFFMLYLFVSLLVSSSLVTYGSWRVLQNISVLTLSIYVFGAVLIVHSSWRLIRSLASHDRRHTLLLPQLLEISLGILLLLLLFESVDLFSAVISLYLSFLTGVKLVDAWIYIRHHDRRFLYALIEASGISAAFVTMWLFPAVRKTMLLFAVSFSAAILVLIVLCDSLAAVLPNGRLRRMLRRFRLTLPAFVSVFLPMRYIQSLSGNASVQQADTGSEELEILFHLSDNGIGIAGHCEVCYQGRTFTYGNYDPASQRLLRTLGQGIVICADRDKYLRWVTENRKLVVSYGLHLDKASRRALEERLQQLRQQMQPWKTPFEQARAKGHAEISDFPDYGSQAVFHADAQLYRLCRGQYRTYFIPTINCVSITNYIVGPVLQSKPILYGINTPGAYLDFLQREYDTGASAVVSRRVYPQSGQAQSAG